MRDNTLFANRLDGIRVETQSSANLIEDNVLRDNAEPDRHDDTLETGTAGTANPLARERGLEPASA